MVALSHRPGISAPAPLREAEAAFRKSLLLDEDESEAYYGLSVALPRQGPLEEGIQCGLHAVSLFHDFPLAHFQLGQFSRDSAGTNGAAGLRYLPGDAPPVRPRSSLCFPDLQSAGPSGNGK